MVDTTPAATHFQTAYLEGEPPWVIGEPQPAVAELEQAGGITGPVLDLGCGAGEHAAMLASLGYDVVAADAAPAAVERARVRAATAGVTVRTAMVDALDPADLAALGRFGTVLDSALFHIFDAGDRVRYARALTGVVGPGGRLVVLALSTEGPGFGPQIGDDDIRGAFTAPDWSIASLDRTVYRGRIVHEHQAEVLGLPMGETVDVPAWIARIDRIGAA